ncbi:MULTISPECIES: DUF885 domain-containing protein [Tessaracoccus]|uniref:DUF885 domain-containing protein n=1 Tax=Tessaracoccus TaxID=72763 RepID=UPI00099C47D9|nr:MULTISPECIES: DUF885 domain-containing protein [Tessaracoccus]AQX15746.1 hypothetical protein BKM78_07330 [Tessaracoccus sp. T2.5-30]VEP40150.1 hypothetical protein TLA_TLA_01484 [Tessaracoccus lapidicaptus]
MTTRTPTPLDQVADAYVDTLVRLSPIVATHIGAPGHDHELDDFSPAGMAAKADAAREALRQVEATEIVDDVDRVTAAAMRERLGLDVELFEAGEDYAQLNNIASPLQGIRDIFDLMPTATTDHWEVIAARMGAVPAAVDGYIESLRLAVDEGPAPAVRQMEIGIAQAEELAGEGSFWRTFGASADLPESLAAALAANADGARAAYARLAEALRDLAPRAPKADGVGRDRYQLLSRQFLGATIDLDETYEWGREELARIVAEQDEVAHQLYGDGTTADEAMRRLDEDVNRRLHGTDALQRWMQETSDAAIAALAGTHFDIADPIRTLECCIAPTQNGGIYYTGPTDDFSRPGRMWWSVPPGVEDFGTWREKTTVYHEGVPGHHLQIAQATYLSGQLNRWRSLICWVSGHGEGWALYAERLMEQLGFLDDPGDRMGMLDAQRMRAARVVLDIGVHLGKPAPDEWGGGTWDGDKAWPFLKANVNMAEEFVRFELDRYLGWPGQAPAYKVGQRLWEQARDEAAARAGAAFDLRDFHRRALDLGSVGLDVLRDALRHAA